MLKSFILTGGVFLFAFIEILLVYSVEKESVFLLLCVCVWLCWGFFLDLSCFMFAEWSLQLIVRGCSQWTASSPTSEIVSSSIQPKWFKVTKWVCMKIDWIWESVGWRYVLTVIFSAAPGSQHLSLLESDSDDDEDIGRVRSDGTLLASDPPKPL